jgi:glucose-6-phosphate dehydrogenase assembly protein OpcA
MAPSAQRQANAARVIARLHNELRDLWKSGDDPNALTRVCTMNIEVVAPSAELLERYTPVIDEVTASIPARAILATIDPNASADDEILGSTTAVCSTVMGESRMCSERINLACRGDAALRAASAIEAFLVPEIPTALVWLGRVHADDPIFEDLATDANRIILDSEYTSIASVIQVATWARKQHNAPDIADLAWTRIAAWQEMLARFFDDAETVTLTSKFTRVVMKQACEPGARIGPEAALMLGWIGTRLGWKTSRLAGALRFTRADGANIAVELLSVSRPKGVAPNALAALTIEAGDHAKKPFLKGSIERELASGLADLTGTTLDADVMVWRCARQGGTEIEQRIRLGANKAAKWLERTLHRPPRDNAFAESVAFAEHIVEDGLIAS